MISESIDVKIPAAEAYRLVSDPRNYGRWSPEATGATFAGDFPLVEGSVFTGQNKLWLPWTGACQVVKADGRTFAFEVKIAGIRVSRWSYIVDATDVRNQFLVRIVNKRNQPERFVLTLARAPEGMSQTGLTTAVEVPALGEIVQPLVLQQARLRYTGPFVFAVRVADAAGKFQLTRDVEFLGPEARLLREEEAEKKSHEKRDAVPPAKQ